MLKWIRKQLLVREWIKLALISVLILAVVVLMLHKPPEPVPPVNLSVPAKPAPEVKHKPKVEKPLKAKSVKVYSPEVKKELKLPEVVQDDPVKDVVASSQVKADDHPQTVTTVINTETGEFETYTKRDPLPWFGVDRHTQASIEAVINTDGDAIARAQLQGEFAQIKALHLGGTLGVDQPIMGTPGEAKGYVSIKAWVNF